MIFQIEGLKSLPKICDAFHRELGHRHLKHWVFRILRVNEFIMSETDSFLFIDLKR